MRTFRDVICRWDTAEQLAADVGTTGLVTRQWKLRDSIPAAHWVDVVAAAHRRGMTDINLKLLADIAKTLAADKPRARAG